MFQTASLARYPPDTLQSEIAQIMLKATNEERGTVAALGALSRELDDLHQDGKFFIYFYCLTIYRITESITAGQRYQVSARYEEKLMSTTTYRQLAKTLCLQNPDRPYHCQAERPTDPRSIPLHQMATFYDYVVLNGARFYSSHAVSSNRSSLVEVCLVDSNTNQTVSRCGELLNIFQFCQMDCPAFFGQMRWFREWKGVRESVWDD